MFWLLLIPAFLYFFLLIFITRNLTGIPLFKPAKVSNTKVSVVIACRNEESCIQYLLSDIISQDHPLELTEVIIVDDWSWDSTPVIAEAYRQIQNLKVVKNNGRGEKERPKDRR